MDRDDQMTVDMAVMDFMRDHPNAPTAKIIRAAVEAAEPLIRADERERHTVNNPLLLADLRAQVEALPGAYIAAGVWENPPVTHDIDNWDGKPVVLRADVLALLDGGSDG